LNHAKLFKLNGSRVSARDKSAAKLATELKVGMAKKSFRLFLQQGLLLNLEAHLTGREKGTQGCFFSGCIDVGYLVTNLAHSNSWN
jgi:hypothetical protein